MCKQVRPIENFIVDIFIAVDCIKRYTENITSSEELVSQECVFDAVLRELAVIGEAMKHIMVDPFIGPSSKPEWRKIINFRNVISHEYFGINVDDIFEIVKQHVPLLEVEMLAFIHELSDKSLLIEALYDAQSDLATSKRYASIDYLNRLAVTLTKK